MRLHTKLDRGEIMRALAKAQVKGHVAQGVFTYVFEEKGKSRTHDHQYEIQLGVSKAEPYAPLIGYVNQYGKPQKTRRTVNGGGGYYAATWHEWGWFIAEVFAADPESRWGDNPERAKRPWGYFSQDDFDQKTDWQFALDDE